MNLTPDGREQTANLVFRGDWMGFDGIPNCRHECSAIALDTGEVWSVRYNSLLDASMKDPRLMRMVLTAMSDQISRGREAAITLGTLTADARVADFLLHWAKCLEARGLRADQFNIPMSRAEIGIHLGIRLESVSRALTRLARIGAIVFCESDRRVITIPNLQALNDFVLDDINRTHGMLH
jgi:CRP/FNR family transcriptional regulator